MLTIPKGMRVFPLLAAMFLIPAGGICEDAASHIQQARVDYGNGDAKNALAELDKALTLDPKNVDALCYRAEVSYAMGRQEAFDDVKGMVREMSAEDYYERGRARQMVWHFTEAIADYSRVIVMTSGNSAKAYASRGSVEQMDGDLDDALADLDMAVRQDGHYAEAWDLRGALRFGKGDAAGAEADFSQAIKLQPENATAYNNRSQARLALGDTKGAMEDADKALELRPKFAVACGTRAVVKLYTGDTEGALADLGKAVELKPDYYIAWHLRGIIRYVKGDAKGAKEDFLKGPGIQDGSGSRQWRVRETPGFVKLFRLDLDGAMADLDAALGNPAKFAKPAEAYAKAYFERWSETGAGEGDSTRAIELKPDFAEAYFARAGSKRSREDWKGALDDMAQAVKLDPKNAQAHYTLACYKQELGDYAGALEEFNNAFRLKPDAPWPLDSHARTEEALGNFKVAMADYMKAIDDGTRAKNNDQVSRNWCDVGRLREEQRDMPGAIAAYTKSLETKPNHVAYHSRARLEFGQGKVDAAADDVAKALALNHGDNEAVYYRALVLEAKGDHAGALLGLKGLIRLFTPPEVDATPEFYETYARLEEEAGEKRTATDALTWAAAIRLGRAVSGDPDYAAAREENLKKGLDALKKLSTTDPSPALCPLDMAAGMNPGWSMRGWTQAGGKSPEECVTSLIAQHPGEKALPAIRGSLRCGRHDYAEALTDFRTAAEAGELPAASRDFIHCAIWLCRAEMGEETEATEELRAYAAGRKPGEKTDGWQADAVQFLTGAMSEEDYLKPPPGSNGPGWWPGRFYARYFYAGVKRSLAGKPAKAAEYFQLCERMTGYQTLESWMARREVRSMNEWE